MAACGIISTLGNTYVSFLWHLHYAHSHSSRPYLLQHQYHFVVTNINMRYICLVEFQRPHPIPSVFLTVWYTTYDKWRYPTDGIMDFGGLTYEHVCLSRYSHYPPPQSLAQLSPDTLSPIVQQVNLGSCLEALLRRCEVDISIHHDIAIAKCPSAISGLGAKHSG